MPMPYTVAAALRVKKKHVAEFTRLVKRHARNSITREPGCVAFEVSVDKDDPRRFIFYEIYLSEADFEAHTQTPWFKRQMERTGQAGIEADALWSTASSRCSRSATASPPPTSSGAAAHRLRPVALRRREPSVPLMTTCIGSYPKPPYLPRRAWMHEDVEAARAV